MTPGRKFWTHHVAAGGQRLDDVRTFGALQIDGDGPLAPVADQDRESSCR